MDISLPADFKEFLQLLNDEQVEYLLVGGYAVGYHGYPRATNDLDVWVAVHQHNAEKLVTVLRKFGFALPELKADLFLNEKGMVRMGVPPIRIEILMSISGVRFDECYAEKMRVVLDSVEVDVINLNNLKKNKQASGRYKDLDDLDNLP